MTDRKYDRILNTNLINLIVMKKFMLVLTAAAMVAACSKDDRKPQTSFEVPEEGGAPQALVLTTNVKAAVEVKSQGGVDKWNAAQNLHVYGYQRIKGGIDYTIATPFVDNVTAVSPAEGAADNSLAVYYPGTTDLYYYDGNNSYDFYGFYVDELPVVPAAVADGILVPVTISGGEDIMVAKADPTADVDKAEEEGFFTRPATGWHDAYAYSAYAARRGIQPTLNFRHQLVRFRFYIVSGSEFDTVGDPDKNLVVKGLSVASRYIADLCVAGDNIGLRNISEQTAPLALRTLDPATNQLVDLVPYEVPSKEVVITDESNLLGESLMVIPNEPVEGQVDSYTINVTMTQFGSENNLPLRLSISDVKDENGDPVTQQQFTAGYSYKVYVKVVGLEDVQISAQLEPWVDGGKVDIDSDVAPEIF